MRLKVYSDPLGNHWDFQFDGDEMNLHMPQDPESEAELKHLAAVEYQMISPGNNASIIGIFQDSMLGSYQFTRENIKFTPREAMNLLMMSKRVNEELFTKGSDFITNFEILSQIMPPMSLKYKTKSFNEETDDKKSSNAILEIKNGNYIRGQIDKSVLGGNSKGIIQRICNDFGNLASSNFIDDLQNIITEYLKSTAFSVGISDLISNEKTNQSIAQIITTKKTDVQNIIDQTQLGMFENNTGKTNQSEFEMRINNILNQATSETGKVGLKSLHKDNRFVTMVNAGSKGSDLNISFMISCLGQQNVDGKRIPYGFEHRTLPHFNKFDDSPSARGFVENSYINGLSPQELFFHAMGGRVGLIDTAIKTATTGYISRRLVKGLEDLMVNYDMTIRTNKNKIVQFSYGDDGIDPTKVENQLLPIVEMSIQDIYAHYNIPDETKHTKILKQVFLKNVIKRHFGQLNEFTKSSQLYTDFMCHQRDEIIKNVFKNKGDTIVNCPVAFAYIISNIQGQCNITASSVVDITLYETYKLIEETYAILEQIHYAPPTMLFKILYYYYLSPKELLIIKRFNKHALTLLLETIKMTYKRAIVAPGEMVGIIAGQSIGEISTQLTLNTFHFAGVSSKSNVTTGVPRIEEILTLTSEPKNPSLNIYLKPEDETDKDKAHSITYMLEHTKLKALVQTIEICFDPNDYNTLIQEDRETIAQFKAFEDMAQECGATKGDETEKSKWIIRMVMDAETMLEKNITMDDLNFTLNNCYENQINCIYSDYNSDKLVFRIRMNEVIKSSVSKTKTGEKVKTKVKPLDQSDHIYMLKNFQDQLLENVVIRGISGIRKVNLRKVKDNVVEHNGSYRKQDIWVLDTIGTNLMEILSLDFIDKNRTVSNNIVEVYDVLGIEAARQTIYNEFVEVIEHDGTYINYHNFSILCDRMTFTSRLISICRHGINNDDIGPIAKASFEETPEMFLKAARHSELDTMRGVSANIMCGQEGFFGTSCFQVILDIKEMQKLTVAMPSSEIENEEEFIDKFFENTNVEDDACDISKLEIRNNVVNIKSKNMGFGTQDADYDPGF